MGSYPRELNLDENTKTKLDSYLNDELIRHDMERPQAIDELKKWQNDYWAEPVSERKTFPFTGAANIIIPLTAIAFEAIHARTMTTLWTSKPFVSVKSRGGMPQLDDAEKPIEDWVDYELEHNVKIYKPANDFCSEIEKFGTGIAKTGYEKIVKKGVREGPAGREEFPVTIKDGATLDAVPQANFLFPYSFRDPQIDPWVGEVHSENPYTVKLMEQSGLFIPGTYEKLLPWTINSGNTDGVPSRSYERKQEELEKRKSIWPTRLYWQEIWLAFDVDGDDMEEDIIVHYHLDSRTIMSVRYNYHDDLHRAYRLGVYFPLEGRWRGIGICKQNAQFQREVTTMHRQRLDNGTLANMGMLKIHKMSGYGPKEPIFPGKMWFVDDMTHVEPFKMNEVYQSAFANEQGTLIYSQQRTGVNEVILGMPQVGTPGTATSDLARIQEGNKKFDFIMKNIKTSMNDILLDIFCNIVQFGPKNIGYFDWAEGGNLLRQVVTMPVEDLRKSLVFEIVAAGQQSNKILDRQNWTQVAQLVTQYYMSLLQLSQGNPQLQALVTQKALSASTEVMKQILDTFDIKNKERIIVQELEKLNAASQPGAISQGGGNRITQGNGNEVPGVDLLTKIAAQFGNGGAAPASTVQGQ